MKILITGANGFLGSKLVRHFYNCGHKIFALVRPTSIIDRIIDLSKNIQIVYTTEELSSTIKKLDIDVIIHTATDYGRKSETILITDLVLANELFPLSLLNDLQEDKTITFINTDSTLHNLSTPYAVSKANFVNWGKYLAEHNKIKFINVILEHFYGFDDDKHKFIEYLVSSLIANIEEMDFTTGEQLRDFIHIDDVVNAFSIIINNLHKFNNKIDLYIGTGEIKKIKDIIKLVKTLTQNTKTKLNFGKLPCRKYEINKTKINTNQLQKLGWYPKINIKDGLNDYINKYKLKYKIVKINE